MPTCLSTSPQYMGGLSGWNFDIFQLDDITNKNSLVVMAYTVFKVMMYFRYHLDFL